MPKKRYDKMNNTKISATKLMSHEEIKKLISDKRESVGGRYLTFDEVSDLMKQAGIVRTVIVNPEIK